MEFKDYLLTILSLFCSICTGKLVTYTSLHYDNTRSVFVLQK